MKLKIGILKTIAIITLAVFCAVFFYYHTQKKPTRNHVNETTNEPKRIVSLAPNITEILFKLGLGEKIAAVSSDSDYPPQAAEKKKTGTFWQPNTEAVVASRPDLVITLSFEQQKAAAQSLTRLGYKVLTLEIKTIEHLWQAIEKIGAATATKDRADQLVATLKNRLDAFSLKVSAQREVKVLWVVQAEPLRVAGRDTFVNDLIELAGGKNAIGPTLQQYPPIGTEQLLSCGADVIIQPDMGSVQIAAQQNAAERFWAKWPNLAPVKNKRIYVLEAATVSRLSPRICDGVELIGKCLYPELFEQKKRPNKGK